MFLKCDKPRLVLILALGTLLHQGIAVVNAQIFPVRSPTRPQAATVDGAIATSVAPFIADGCHVGLSIVVMQGGVAHFYNFGSTSRKVSTQPTADSVYEIGSVTKTFTGALAAKALAEHRMELDTDFRNYLPQSYPNLALLGHPITLRSLATHRSGLPRDLPNTDDLYAARDFEKLPSQLIARDRPYNHGRYLKELHGVHLQSVPGTEEKYSNLGIKVIGWGLEQVFNAPFETLVRSDILQPLNMDSTGFVLNAKQRRRLVVGYSRGGNPMPYHLQNAGAAYGLYSTASDMAKYIRWQLNESTQVIRLAHELIQGDAASGEALIWNVASDHGSRMLWHGGGTFGMTSQVVLYPDEKEGFALLANDTCTGTEGLLKTIASMVHNSLK
jgi:serine-type D-Ala-D-Ala carboxypeptidase/endopeptidase